MARGPGINLEIRETTNPLARKRRLPHRRWRWWLADYFPLRAHNHNSGEKNVEPEANHSEVFYSLFPVLSLPVPCFPPYPHPPHPVEIYFRPLQFL